MKLYYLEVCMKIGKNVGLLFCVRARAVLALINRQHKFNTCRKKLRTSTELFIIIDIYTCKWIGRSSVFNKT
jgi:hypothetical protein